MALKSPFRVKLDCGVMRTLGWHHTGITGTYYVFLLQVGVSGCHRPPLGGTDSVLWNSRLCAWENVTRASVQKVPSGKWMKYHFWMIYPFNWGTWNAQRSLVSCITEVQPSLVYFRNRILLRRSQRCGFFFFFCESLEPAVIASLSQTHLASQLSVGHRRPAALLDIII